MSETWTALAENLLAAHHYFLEVAAKLDDSLRDKSGVCGAWSPREVVAHLVGWDAEAVRGFGLAASGQVETFVSVANDAIHDFNAESVASRRELSWEEVIEALKSAQQDLQGLIKDVDAQGYDAAGGFGMWLVGRRDDYVLHTGQLLKWLEEGS